MITTGPLRLAAGLSGLVALAAFTCAPATTSTATAGTAPAKDRLVASTYPTNAGKVFRWGLSQWHDGFVERLTRDWSVNRPRQVDNQHGMLTLNATAAGHTVSATLVGHAHRYGRWETRVRAEQYTSGRTPYRVVAELIPASTTAYHCGARSIVPASYDLGTRHAHMYIRNLPNEEFTDSKALNLGPGQFHTYAVEVTKTHVSWFVDTRVIMTERRDAALSGATYTVRFRMVAQKGAAMNAGRMQMDWVRYYTLDRPNARSIDAPQATRGTFADAC
jgi:hypothetical protein